MAHLPALPGTPLYDEQGGPDAIVEWVRRDVEILTRSGFDAVASSVGTTAGAEPSLDAVDAERADSFMAAVREARRG
jgi:predicted TIM-barrel enzyme